MISFKADSIDWEKMDGLVPTVVQDETGQVVMLAFSNEESLKRAIETEYAWYYSRSRNKLWKKGESSGNTQKISEISTDCDKDAILFKIKQKGSACHTGNYSCFGDKEFNFQELFEIIKDRKMNPKKESYTSSLFDDSKGAVNKILEKIGEESAELIIAVKDNKKEDIVYELGDIFYFLMVLMAEKNIYIGDLLSELKKRRK
ncbi:bifunctional phosphoribosyl-AMP cyclohydrolase/phosphoribosyl-ATP diphosphatase HisIE [Candidatus Woesearchaeota archaeon]|nr:bifunctional phosphoribosyl-AMP cyclohydrolase/phosphoribosyl-ATP diphosphatase HisIE [Candidatus Woesearchaeota archaeon]